METSNPVCCVRTFERHAPMKCDSRQEESCPHGTKRLVCPGTVDTESVVQGRQELLWRDIIGVSRRMVLLDYARARARTVCEREGQNVQRCFYTPLFSWTPCVSSITLVLFFLSTSLPLLWKSTAQSSYTRTQFPFCIFAFVLVIFLSLLIIYLMNKHFIKKGG